MNREVKASSTKLFALLAGLLFLGSFVLGYFAWQGRQGAAVVIEWSTASEMDTAGFHLYRGESSAGPFERITPDLIPASPDPLAGGDYAYTDRQVLPGHVYFYQLEEVEMDGEASRNGPIEVRAKPGGGLELLLSVLLLLLAGLSAAWAFRHTPRSELSSVSVQE